MVNSDVEGYTQHRGGIFCSCVADVQLCGGISFSNAEGIISNFEVILSVV